MAARLPRLTKPSQRRAQEAFPAQRALDAAAERYADEAGASGGYFVGARRAHAAAGLLRRHGPPGRGRAPRALLVLGC